MVRVGSKTVLLVVQACLYLFACPCTVCGNSFSASGAFVVHHDRQTRLNRLASGHGVQRARKTIVAVDARPVRQTSRLLVANKDNAVASDSEVDVDALTKYGAAILIQMTLLTTLFWTADRIVDMTGMREAGNNIPFAVNVAIFYALSLKSRVFNPLSNKRPNPKTLAISDQPDRKTPSWTPPGVVFPIVWLLIVGPLRATSSALIYQDILSYANPAILSLALHLSIGDVWNTINNVERRYGAAAAGVIFVWLSNAVAAYQYYQVDHTAGILLSLPLIWLTIAGSLVFATWRLNPMESDGNETKLDALYPVRRADTKTEFIWFSSNKKEV